MKKSRDNRNNQRLTGQQQINFEPVMSHPMDDLGAIMEEGDVKESVIVPQGLPQA